MRTFCLSPRRLIALTLLWLPMLAVAATFQIRIDTTPLAGQSGYLAFDLFQGDPATSNQVTIAAFAGTATLGASTRTGNVVGSLPGAVTLVSSTFFGELLQAVVFGAGATTFNLTLSENYLAANTPDNFAVYLLNSAFTPYVTSDPSGANALLSVDLLSPLTPQAYVSGFAAISVVPELANAELMLAGLLLLAGWRRLR